jgi:hypothetical protein
MNNRHFLPSLSGPSGFPTTNYEFQEACISLAVAGLPRCPLAGGGKTEKVVSKKW